MITHSKPIFPIPPFQWAHLKSYFTQITIPAKHILLKEGEISHRGYVVEQGCLRACVNSNGVDKTFQFFFEGGVVASIESIRKSTPSLITIESVEPCVLWVVEKAGIEEIFSYVDGQPELRKLLYDFVFERTFVYMKHHLSFITDTPAQRYEHLLAKHPQILLRVPQHYIASHLGVSAVHLSRIKNGFATRDKKS